MVLHRALSGGADVRFSTGELDAHVQYPKGTLIRNLTYMFMCVSFLFVNVGTMMGSDKCGLAVVEVMSKRRAPKCNTVASRACMEVTEYRS
jgi:hypothetical protein